MTKPVPKKTDHQPLEPALRPDHGPNPAGKYYANPAAAQDLKKKSDSEEMPPAGGT